MTNLLPTEPYRQHLLTLLEQLLIWRKNPRRIV
jgi:hypothetical protein